MPPYCSSAPVPCAAGRQQAHEFELLSYNDPDCDTSFESFSVNRAQAYVIIIENFGTVWFAYVPLARQICRKNSPDSSP